MTKLQEFAKRDFRAFPLVANTQGIIAAREIGDTTLKLFYLCTAEGYIQALYNYGIITNEEYRQYCEDLRKLAYGE